MNKAAPLSRNKVRIAPPDPPERYRVEGLARRGRVMYAHITKRGAQWRVTSTQGFCLEVYAATVEEVLKKIGRKLPFRPVAVRCISGNGSKPDS